MKSKIYKNVLIGKNTKIDPPCILGLPPRGKKAGEAALKIGDNSFIRSFSVIYADTKIGRNFQTGIRATIREDNIIGNNVKVGTSSVLEWGNRIGNNVRIHSRCFLEMAYIEDDVFVGPGVIMTDDPHPPCPKYSLCKGGVVIRKNAKIGAGAVLLPGVEIGKNALVGAGSVVVKNVKADEVVVGNPAKVISMIKDLKCIKKYFSRPYVW